MTKLLAIVPAYNEGAAIAATVDDIRRHAPAFDVVVVDDGSTDDTSDVATSVGAQVVRHPFNLGIGGAVQSGYQYALDHDYDVAIQVDGDGQHDARHIADDGHGYRSSASRRVGIRLFSWVLSGVCGRRITDPTSGFRMTDRKGIELFARDYPHDYPEVEAVLMCHAHRLTAEELPVKMRARHSGRSSIGSTQSVYYMVKVTLAVFVGLLRTRPNIQSGDEAPVVAEHSI
jgi:glycosyltransferase involved in cell wall biosynthesis